jgi:hypothetical protein
MQKDRIKQVLRSLIPILAFIFIFGLALACGGSPEEAIESTEKEIKKEIKEEAVGVEEANVTVENIKAKGNYTPLGESVEYDGLKVSVTDCIVMSSYKKGDTGTEYPKEGAKFILIYVKAENVGKQEKYLPDSTDFYLLYIDSFIENGNLWGWSDSIDGKKAYSSEIVMPGVSREGWTGFEVPKDVKAEDILVALECDYDEYYYWEVPEPLKEVSPEAKAEEQAEAEEGYLTLGQAIEYEGIKTSVIKYEFAEWIKTESEPRYPEEGAIFLWIYVKAENIGEVAIGLPDPTSFYVLYKGTGMDHDYWNEDYSIDHVLYSGGWVYPGIGNEGWILFDLPSKAKPEDITTYLIDYKIPTGGECIWKLEE